MIQETLAAVEAGKFAVASLKAIANADAAFDKAELKLRIAEIATTVLGLMEANQQLREEVRRIEELLKVKGQVIFHDDAVWRRLDGKTTGPFCSQCWDATDKLIHLVEGDSRFPTCPTCKRSIHKFTKADQVPIPAA